MIEVRIYWRFAFTITTLSSKEFDQNPIRAKRAAKDGPVFITDHGRHAYVLLTMEEYRKNAGKRESIIDLLAMPEMAEIDPDFEFPRLGDEFPQPADFS
jgi:PHD/YefM family antitoxin component YafN of YafNO toxin-antitoxin module